MRTAAVILPDLGTGPDTPIVVSYWFAARGEKVWEGERLVEVLVGPATFDVPAPVTGRLVKIFVREDDTVLPGAHLGALAVLDEESDDDRADGFGSGGGDHGRSPPGAPGGPGHRPS